MTLAIEKPPAAPAAPITADEFEEMPGTKGYELIDGALVEKNMSYLSGVVEANVLRLLGDYSAKTGAGWAAASEGGFRCFADRPNQVRKPDASFVSVDRMSAAQIPARGYPRLAPDLAVEVVSPGDSFSEVLEKVEEFLAAGTKHVWVIDPATRTVEVRRPKGSNTVLHETDDLDGEDVLPGFKCRVGDLFPPRTAPAPPVTSPTTEDKPDKGA